MDAVGKDTRLKTKDSRRKITDKRKSHGDAYGKDKS